MNLFNHCNGTKNNNFYKKLVFGFFVAFILILLPAQNNLTFAEINPNIKTAIYKDVSPGVTGQLEISTETTSPDMGNISIKGFLKYDFPPQPQNISFTIKNIDGKNTFKDFTITSPASTANPIDVVFTNIPIDKISKTTSLATKDRFLITSKTEKGVDFFFTGNSTYLGFNSFQEPAKTTTTTTTSSTSKPILTIEPGAPYTQSIVVTGSTLVSPKTTKKAATANVDFAVITLLPNNHTTPTYITFEKFVDTKTSETTTSEWAETADAINPRPDLYVLGASKHPLLVEQGKVYTIKTWASDSPTTKLGEGKYLGTFLINTDYLFGKKISNTAPGLAPVNQQTLDNVWASITGTFNPGDIEFFKVGGTDGLVAGSKDAYIFLANIPGLANTTVTGTDGKPYPAFDPTIEGSFSKYITTFINIVYGLIALLTVLNIIYYGFQLMARSTVPFMKKENKDRITNSFIALLIALGSYLLLNTINPNLTNWGVGLVRVEVPGADMDFKAAMEEEVKGNPTAATNLTTYLLAGTFTNPKPSNPGIKACADKLAGGQKITKLEVTAIAPSNSGNKMDIYTASGLCATVPVNIGAGGTTTWPKSELKKTPKGANGPEVGSKSTTQQSRSRLPKSNMEPAICTGSNNKKFNCGAAFIETGILNEKGELRYIGIHGQGNNELKPTAGCIRMKNDDLVLLAKYFIGVDLYIK